MTDADRMLLIDEERLDQECLDQPSLVANNCRDRREARAEVEEAEAAYKFAYSDVMLKVRKDPGRYDLEDKPPIDLIKACVEIQPKVRVAAKKLREAKKILATFSDAGLVLEHRKKSLENLVRLAGIDFHSEPDVGRGEMLAQLRESRKKTRSGIRPERRRT